MRSRLATPPLSSFVAVAVTTLLLLATSCGDPAYVPVEFPTEDIQDIGGDGLVGDPDVADESDVPGDTGGTEASALHGAFGPASTVGTGERLRLAGQFSTSPATGAGTRYALMGGLR